MTQLILDPGGNNEQKITKDEIRDINPIREHTALSDFTATLATDTEYISAVQRQDRVNVKVDGTVVFCGFVTDTSIDKNSPEIRLEGVGIAKKLEENRPDYSSLGGSLTYSSKALDEAIRDYWGRTSFSNYNVVDQSTSKVVDSDLLQNGSSNSGFSDDISFNDDEPVEIRNGTIELLKCTFLSEAEDATKILNATEETNLSDHSGAAGVKCDAVDEGVTFNFTPDHTIPDGEYDLFYIRELNSFDGTIDLSINGTVEKQSTFSGATGLSPTGESIVNQGKLEAGNSQSITVDISSYNSGDIIIDLLFLTDSGRRFSEDFNIETVPTNFDSNDSTYPAPEIYPEEYNVEFDTVSVSYNVTKTDLDTEWGNDNVSNKQRISASNDGGDNYLTANNTENLTFDHQANNQLGRQPKIRMRLSRFTSDPTTTPSTGDTFQYVESFSHQVDGNDRAVIDDLELTRNHFENLQQLHGYGDFLWTIEHGSESISNLPVESYQRGDKTAPKPSGFDDPESKSIEIAAKRYYNTIFVQGSEDSNGNRPTAEVKDSTLVSNDGREISPGVLRDPKVTTQGGADYRARTLLDNATDNNSRYGTLTVPLTVADPGYARPVDLGNGDVDKVVERVDMRLSPDTALATFRLTPPEQIADEIANLKRKSRDISDQV